MDKQDKPKRKRVRDLQVHEISLVDNPAVPKAKFVIVKRQHSEGGDSVMETKCGSCGQMTKRGEEEYGDQSLPKSGEGAMDFLHRVSGQLVSMRRAFPVAIREMLMALDLALDSTLKQEKPMNEEDEKKAEQEKAEHERTEKEAADKVAAEKIAQEKAGHEEDEEDEKKGKKGEHQDCPPGMKFDIPSQKCVPMNEEDKKKSEEKAAEKAEPEKTEKVFDASLGEIEFSEEDEKGLDNLLS